MLTEILHKKVRNSNYQPLIHTSREKMFPKIPRTIIGESIAPVNAFCHDVTSRLLPKLTTSDDILTPVKFAYISTLIFLMFIIYAS